MESLPCRQVLVHHAVILQEAHARRDLRGEVQQTAVAENNRMGLLWVYTGKRNVIFAYKRNPITKRRVGL